MEKLDVVINRSEIEQRIKTMGKQISDEYRGKEFVVIGILNGAFIFMADLVRSISIPHEIDFVRVSSYGDEKNSSGKIHLSKDIEIDVGNKHVLLVEDIVDTGKTLSWLGEHFGQKQAKSVRICSLIDKKERRERDIAVDYHGFVVEKGFLVGYGLDFAEKYRYLPEVFSLRD
jgi:hypoxanthine phosphoribosyltransferase